MAQSFYPTAQNIIDAALRAIRAVDPDSSVDPTTTQRTNALQTLNFLVTSWQAHGMQVWCTKNASLTMVDGTSSYTVGPSGSLNIARPNSITQAWLHNTSANTDPIPLEIIGRERYNGFTAKATEGTPHSLWYDPEYDLPGTNSGANAKGKLYLYPTPGTIASTHTLTLVYTRPIQDFSATSDSLDFPPMWFNAVKWNLAAQIAPEYGVPVMAQKILDKIAKDTLDEVKGFDAEEGSMFIYPVRRS